MGLGLACAFTPTSFCGGLFCIHMRKRNGEPLYFGILSLSIPGMSHCLNLVDTYAGSMEIYCCWDSDT